MHDADTDTRLRTRECRTPTLAVWGGVAAVGALFFLEQVPPVKRDILARIPIVGQRYVTEPEK